MREGGKVIWLTALPETILARSNADAATLERRPRLTDQTPLEEIVQLLRRREPIYREAADVTIDTEAKPPTAIAAEIIEKLHLEH